MKTKNIYQQYIDSELYRLTPKAVFAAIAVSYMVNLQNKEPSEISSEVIAEWAVLFANDIVPQKPLKASSAYIRGPKKKLAKN